MNVAKADLKLFAFTLNKGSFNMSLELDERDRVVKSMFLPVTEHEEIILKQFRNRKIEENNLSFIL